jgi:type 1 glutamine amidotransferase
LLGTGSGAPAAEAGLVVKGGVGPGRGKHIVFVTGEEFYRSEEGMSMFAKLLARRHGFDCTVLFATDPESGFINPNQSRHIPGLEALKSADVMVLFARFRELPDGDMKYIAAHVNAGKPVLGVRNATHAFRYPAVSASPYKNWDYRSKDWQGGFGQQILGDTWVAHYGKFQKEATLAFKESSHRSDPVLRGVADTIFCHTDVNSVLRLTPADEVLFRGQVLSGLNPTDEPVNDARKDVRMPFAWFRTYTAPSGALGRSFTTTAGASLDWLNEDLRRLFVNAVFSLSGLESAIGAKTDVTFVGDYQPKPTGMLPDAAWAKLMLTPSHFAEGGR